MGPVFAAYGTWRRLTRTWGWRRPRRRLYPAKPRVGIRTQHPGEWLHIDTTSPITTASFPARSLADGHPMRLSWAGEVDLLGRIQSEHASARASVWPRIRNVDVVHANRRIGGLRRDRFRSWILNRAIARRIRRQARAHRCAAGRALMACRVDVGAELQTHRLDLAEATSGVQRRLTVLIEARYLSSSLENRTSSRLAKLARANPFGCFQPMTIRPTNQSAVRPPIAVSAWSIVALLLEIIPVMDDCDDVDLPGRIVPVVRRPVTRSLDVARPCVNGPRCRRGPRRVSPCRRLLPCGFRPRCFRRWGHGARAWWRGR